MKKLVLVLLVMISFQLSAYSQYASWIVEPNYEEIKDFTDAVAQVKRNGKWGCINTEGEEFVKCEYDTITNFVEGVAIAYTKDTNKLKAIIHQDGLVITTLRNQNGGLVNAYIDPRYPYYGSDMLLVTDRSVSYVKDKRYTKWGYLDKNGILKLPVKYIGALPFSEGLAGVADMKGKYSYINNIGEIVITNSTLGGKRIAGAYGFNNGIALVQEKDYFFFIDSEGEEQARSIGEVVPLDKYINIKSNIIECEENNKLVIDSLGRIRTLIRIVNNVEQNIPLVKAAKAKETIKGEGYFIVNGEQRIENEHWISPECAVLSKNNKLGVIKLLVKPIININFTDNQITSIFGNIEPITYTLSNETDAPIKDVEVKINGKLTNIYYIPVEGIKSTITIEKLTDKEKELIPIKLEVSQRGVLLMEKELDVEVTSGVALEIRGRNDYVYDSENNTFTMIVDVVNKSNYPLKNATLTINNYQTFITVPAKTTKDYSTIFGVDPDSNEVPIVISIKAPKSPIIQKQGTFTIDNINN